ALLELGAEERRERAVAGGKAEGEVPVFIGQDVALILMEVEPEAGAPSERARQLELGVDHPEPRGQAGLRGADRLRRALPLVPPVPGEAREVVVDHALVVALLGLGIE